MQAVFSKYSFHFTYTLTLIHTVTTVVGMWVLSSVFGLFVVKPLSLRKVTPLAAAFVGGSELPQGMTASLNLAIMSCEYAIISPTIIDGALSLKSAEQVLLPSQGTLSSAI